ncbi:Hsp70 family protein [Ramlibacter ginsenosidimutans]|uniref:Hsp70 family protein n=1 Tax=Ramlibacter ginsenosidimutans TaxID=502333 RepID=A0A934TY17_9BURK|nr:Hsp70 family protein [Ramlibacter ginsenosidimutans]MBK6009368.1 Hsp70 family protein [Ramlibacter ginsenosidimutans]
MSRSPQTSAFCAIDFGTSNSAIAVPGADGRMALVDVEDGQVTMPTAVFYQVEGRAAHEPPLRLYGRAALAAYIEGHEGRLMRSMKSVLGSSLADQQTEVGGGHAVRYLDIVGGYLQHLKTLAERASAAALERVVLGRPVHFVDDDPRRDAQAQDALAAAARAVGFTDVSFQYEPIAAALDYELQADHEQLVLVADIGGGTSDFSLVRVGPERRQRLDRRADILANHGVHVAGTDFDRQVELATILPACGYRGLGPARPGVEPREVPSRVYFDLATWHLVNTVYTAPRVHELRRMKSFYGDPRQHARLMTVVEEHLGHALLGQAEAAKIAVAEGGATRIDLGRLERGLASALDEREAVAALEADLERIVQAARDTLRAAGVGPEAVEVLYLTGGSTGFTPLVQRIAAAVPRARAIQGDRHASVAQGLGVHAQRLHAASRG